MVTLVMGLPGSGKSFFAKSFAEKRSAIYISSDVLRKNLIADPEYNEAEKLTVYEHLLEQMLRITRVGKEAVLDATFFRNDLRKKFLSTLDARNIKFRIIEITASEKDIKERLSKARKDSDADYKVYLKIKEQWEPIKQEKLTLNSSRMKLENMLSRAEDFVS